MCRGATRAYYLLSGGANRDGLESAKPDRESVFRKPGRPIGGLLPLGLLDSTREARSPRSVEAHSSMAVEQTRA
jgi:hypothetical protein